MVWENRKIYDSVQLQKTPRLPSERWFCRVWIKYDYGHSYGRNKFEAYRKAIIDLKNKQ